MRACSKDALEKSPIVSIPMGALTSSLLIISYKSGVWLSA
jgi:hypothetical protein